MKQPSVIAYGDASSLDAKTQFVASYAPRETASRANVALRRREHIKVRSDSQSKTLQYHYIFPEREGGCEFQRADGRVAALPSTYRYRTAQKSH